jgi:UDP-2,4-diacetamido-2,4,6-trideoxy-beta-L-altropyranose hydrolase
VFRADASAAIGAGHIMRCLTLANALTDNGWRIVFAGRAESGLAVPALRQLGHRMIAVPAERESDAVWLGQQIDDVADLLIVDHYLLASEFETAAREWADTLLVIDDLENRRHDCDILLDQNFGRGDQDYLQLVPVHCTRLLGARHALVRPDFAALRAQALSRRAEDTQLRRILVSMGASDPTNMTSVVLAGLREAAIDVEIDVLITGISPHVEEIRAKALAMGATLHLDRIDIWELMLKADMAVGAGGSSSWERCVLALPTLIVIAADNQRLIASHLQKAGAADLIGGGEAVSPSAVAQSVLRINRDRERRQAMAQAAAAICDGRGAERVRRAIADQGPRAAHIVRKQ